MTDEMLFQGLKQAFEARKVDVVGDYRVLNQPSSYVYSAWDNVAPLLLLLVASLVVMIVFKLLAGIVALLVAVALYVVGVRTWVANRLHGRLSRLLFRDLTAFNVLWRGGGFSLLWIGPQPELCRAPEGNWRYFAERHTMTAALAAPEGEEDGVPA